MLPISLFVFAVACMVAAWWFVIRPLVRNASGRAASAWGRLRSAFDGLKTVIAARLVWLGGTIIGLHDYLLPIVAGVDWTPLTAGVPAWSVPLAIVATGALFEWLRRITAPVPPAAKIETLD